MTASPAGSRIGQPRPWRDDDDAGMREWQAYQIKNRLANREYARNRDTIDRRYGEGVRVAEGDPTANPQGSRSQMTDASLVPLVRRVVTTGKALVISDEPVQSREKVSMKLSSVTQQTWG